VLLKLHHLQLFQASPGHRLERATGELTSDRCETRIV
jgi:hypothetical protein